MKCIISIFNQPEISSNSESVAGHVPLQVQEKIVTDLLIYLWLHETLWS